MLAFVSYSTPQRLKWKDLDALTTADEIARFLLAHGIKGICGSYHGCPLAVATNSVVGKNFRRRGFWYQRLTPAERQFVFYFDHYSYLPLSIY